MKMEEKEMKKRKVNAKRTVEKLPEVPQFDLSEVLAQLEDSGVKWKGPKEFDREVKTGNTIDEDASNNSLDQKNEIPTPSTSSQALELLNPPSESSSLPLQFSGNKSPSDPMIGVPAMSDTTATENGNIPAPSKDIGEISTKRTQSEAKTDARNPLPTSFYQMRQSRMLHAALAHAKESEIKSSAILPIPKKPMGKKGWTWKSLSLKFRNTTETERSRNSNPVTADNPDLKGIGRFGIGKGFRGGRRESREARLRQFAKLFETLPLDPLTGVSVSVENIQNYIFDDPIHGDELSSTEIRTLVDVVNEYVESVFGPSGFMSYSVKIPLSPKMNRVSQVSEELRHVRDLLARYLQPGTTPKKQGSKSGRTYMIGGLDAVRKIVTHVEEAVIEASGEMTSYNIPFSLRNKMQQALFNIITTLESVGNIGKREAHEDGGLSVEFKKPGSNFGKVFHSRTPVRNKGHKTSEVKERREKVKGRPYSSCTDDHEKDGVDARSKELVSKKEYVQLPHSWEYLSTLISSDDRPEADQNPESGPSNTTPQPEISDAQAGVGQSSSKTEESAQFELDGEYTLIPPVSKSGHRHSKGSRYGKTPMTGTLGKPLGVGNYEKPWGLMRTERGRDRYSYPSSRLLRQRIGRQGAVSFRNPNFESSLNSFLRSRALEAKNGVEDKGIHTERSIEHIRALPPWIRNSMRSEPARNSYFYPMMSRIRMRKSSPTTVQSQQGLSVSTSTSSEESSSSSSQSSKEISPSTAFENVSAEVSYWARRKGRQLSELKNRIINLFKKR